jgi:hypothetical protein
MSMLIIICKLIIDLRKGWLYNEILESKTEDYGKIKKRLIEVKE